MTEMKTWYAVNAFDAPKINKCKHIRETKNSLVNLRGQHYPKNGKYYRFFDNLPDAEAFKAELDKRRADKKARRRIRAAAHDLLAALELIADTEPDPDNMQRFHDIANAAIAKARGDA